MVVTPGLNCLGGDVQGTLGTQPRSGNSGNAANSRAASCAMCMLLVAYRISNENPSDLKLDALLRRFGREPLIHRSGCVVCLHVLYRVGALCLMSLSEGYHLCHAGYHLYLMLGFQGTTLEFKGAVLEYEGGARFQSHHRIIWLPKVRTKYERLVQSSSGPMVGSAQMGSSGPWGTRDPWGRPCPRRILGVHGLCAPRS